MLDVQIDVGPHFFLLFKMQYLYIDESLDEKVFVVGGILVNSEKDLLLAYSQFKKQIMNIPMTRKQKENVTYEFKSSLLDRTYPQIKRKLLYKLNILDCNIVYSYKKLDAKLVQEDKENFYIELLSKIVSNINEDVTIITFDSFGNTKFENRIVKEIREIKNVKSIIKDESYNNKGLQFADNVVGVIRRKLSNVDDNGFFDIISNRTIEI